MATIGVYPDRLGREVRIRAIHINVWMLPAELRPRALLRAAGRRRWHATYLDIGLRLSARDGLPPYLEMLLPGEVQTETGFADLSREATDPDISDLIFGSNVEVRKNQIIYEQDGNTVRDTCVPVSAIRRVGPFRYRLILKSAISRGDYYLRFRVELGGGGDTLVGKGWALAKRGVVLDLRVNDVRGTVALPVKDQADKLCDIGTAFVFAITPIRFISAMHSPKMKYIRSLETEGWMSYLHSCKDVSLSHRASIYYWKSSENITSTDPYRTYLHLHADFGWWVFVIYVLGVLSGPTISLLHGWFPTLGQWLALLVHFGP